MEENKVIIKLDDYVEMREKLKELEFMNNTIIDYVLSSAELENGKLEIDFNIRYSKFMTEIVRKNYPKKYEERLKELLEEDK